jgi:hypothetical protein
MRLLTAAATLLAVLVVPVAFAGTGGDSGGPHATASGVKGKVKKLTAKVKDLEARLAALEGQGGGTGGGTGGGASQPSGPAGGDLTGTYPNPLIAAGAVGSQELGADAVDSPGKIALDAVGASEIAQDAVAGSEIATNAVDTVEISNNAVDAPEIGSDAVGASELLDLYVSVSGTAQSITDGTAENGNYTTGTTMASCVPGDQAISGWGSWTDNAANDELFISEVGLATGPDQVTVVGGNDTGAERHLVANVLCVPDT